MIVKAEIFVDYQSQDDDEDIDDVDAQWDTMHKLAFALKDFHEIIKIRMPDSPEPDITGHIIFDRPSIPTFTSLRRRSGNT